MKTSITFDIDTDRLRDFTDRHIADLWHVAQANPAPLEDRDAGELVELIGREIIRRWLTSTPPELWLHQGKDYYWKVLAEHGSWPGPDHKTWVPTPLIPLDAAEPKPDTTAA